MREGGGEMTREGASKTRDGVVVREAWQGVAAREGGGKMVREGA